MEEDLKREGFDVVGTASVSLEQLSEAGLDLGVSEVGASTEGKANCTMLLVEKEDALRSLENFKSRSKTSRDKNYPRLITAASPSLIESHFPSLAISSPQETISSTLPSDAVSDKTPTKLFPLSNFAFDVKTSPSPTLPRNLSPKIAQALEQLETQRGPTSSQVYPRERRVFEESTKKAEEEEDEVKGRKVEGVSRQAEQTLPISEGFCPISSKEILPEGATRPESSTGLSVSATSAASSTSFKARPAPPPTIQPRMTKAAALRLGVAVPPLTPRASTKRQSISTSERAALDRLTRRQSVQLPPSTAVSTKPVEVRMSKAAMLRMGVPLPTTTEGGRRSRQSTAGSFAGSDVSSTSTERRASVSSSLKSLREPAIAPRSTKSSSLRTGSTTERTSSTSGRGPLAILEDEEPTKMAPPSSHPAPKRRHSVQVQSTMHPAVEVRMSRASMLRNGQTVAPSSSSTSRSRISNVNFDGVPGHKRRESIAVPSMHQAPLHTPRPNRASLLRQKSDTIAPSSSARRTPSAISSSVSSSSHARLPSTSSTGPRLNRAAELRQKTFQAAGGKEQVPATPKRREGIFGGTRAEGSRKNIVGSAEKTPRPKSAMSDLSNGSRV
ncbi:hypothetical protein JCM3765_001657 [Sporobolomyces pararoseus]